MMERWIGTAKPYRAVIADGALASAGKEFRALFPSARACVVTDDAVRALWMDGLSASLRAAGVEFTVFSFPGGEEHKTLSTVECLFAHMEDAGMTRADAVIAFGGGIVSDVAGFAAATFLRGIPFVTIPTTLLAAVDAAVGGKTGVNFAGRKNRVGAFHQPALVLCDTAVFRTLPPGIRADGMAEVIKYGMLFDGGFPERVKDGGDEALVAECIRMKAETVAADEFDRGTRKLLNFGHTAAHAVEACSGERIRHGHAVAIGMMAVTRAAVKRGICPPETAALLSSRLTAANLPVCTDIPERELIAAMASDKKREGDTVTLVVPVETGKCELLPLPAEALGDFFAGCFL